jgi:hypothetical protein
MRTRRLCFRSARDRTARVHQITYAPPASATPDRLGSAARTASLLSKIGATRASNRVGRGLAAPTDVHARGARALSRKAANHRTAEASPPARPRNLTGQLRTGDFALRRSPGHGLEIAAEATTFAKALRGLRRPRVTRGRQGRGLRRPSLHPRIGAAPVSIATLTGSRPARPSCRTGTAVGYLRGDAGQRGRKDDNLYRAVDARAQSSISRPKLTRTAR